MTEPEAEIVQFDNVGLRYGTGKEALTDISFTLYPGRFYFLTGASGAGKTSVASVPMKIKAANGRCLIMDEFQDGQADSKVSSGFMARKSGKIAAAGSWPSCHCS